MAEWRTLQFLGAAGTSTGSKHLVRINDRQLLLDCGLFDGPDELRTRDRQPPPFDVRRLDAVVLSQAGLHHAGYLPVLVRSGFHGPVFCTPSTEALLRATLVESAEMQAEDAECADRHDDSAGPPAPPLFTSADAEAALRLIRAEPYGKPFAVTSQVTALFRRAAHVLGAATVQLHLGDQDELCLVYAGDLGRSTAAMLGLPEPVEAADVLLVESTLGDSLHGDDPADALATVVGEAAARGGALIVPTSATTAQQLTWILRDLEERGRVPSLPVYLDSPLAFDVADVYSRHLDDHNVHLADLVAGRLSPRQSRNVTSVSDSKALDQLDGPIIILAPTDMASGGRVLRHLKHRLPDERTTVLLPGFQAAGTRGRALRDGARELRIHGEAVAVRANVVSVDGIPPHADRDDILRWLAGFHHAPRLVSVVHGEPGPAAALVAAIRTRLGWHATVARDGQTIGLEQ